MDLYEILMKRRSIRVFQEQEIPDEIIEKLLDVAIHGPSGGNLQPFSIILVRSQEGKTISKLNSHWIPPTDGSFMVHPNSSLFVP